MTDIEDDAVESSSADLEDEQSLEDDASDDADDDDSGDSVDEYIGNSSVRVRGWSVTPREGCDQMIKTINFLRTGDGFRRDQNTDDECLVFVKGLSLTALNLVTKVSGSLLNVAAKHNRESVVSFLLASGSHFHQVTARSFMGRTALHDAILRRDPWFNERLKWGADYPAVQALKTMLEHPLCDNLVNAHDDAGKPPFFYALRAYARSRIDLARTGNPYCDALLEIRCSHDKPCKSLLSHPSFSKTSVTLEDMRVIVFGMETSSLLREDDVFKIGSKTLHRSGITSTSLARMVLSRETAERMVGRKLLSEDLKNDILQCCYGVVVQQICLRRQLPVQEVAPLLKAFLGFDLVAEKLLRDKRLLRALIRGGSATTNGAIAKLAESIDSRMGDEARSGIEAATRRNVQDHDVNSQKRSMFRKLLEQAHSCQPLSAEQAEQLRNLRAEGISGFRRLEWHLEKISGLMRT